MTMVMFTWGASIYIKESRPPKDALQINVVAKQWMWKLQHMEGQREINELHIPMGRAVRLTMTSEDVIHSFFVRPSAPSRMWCRAAIPLSGSAHQAGQVSPVLRRVLRHQALRHDRLGLCDGASGVRRLAERRSRPRSLAESGGKLFNGPGVQQLP